MQAHEKAVRTTNALTAYCIWALQAAKLVLKVVGLSVTLTSFAVPRKNLPVTRTVA